MRNLLVCYKCSPCEQSGEHYNRGPQTIERLLYYNALEIAKIHFYCRIRIEYDFFFFFKNTLVRISKKKTLVVETIIFFILFIIENRRF